VLRTADREASDPTEREHVTPFVYRRPDRFTLAAVESGAELGHARWVVDTAEDLDRVRAMVARFSPRIDMPWTEMLTAFPVALPAPGPPGSVGLRRARPDDGDFLRGLRNDPEVIRTSGTGRGVDADEHATWFARVLTSPAVRLYVVADAQGVRVGQVRVDVHDGIGVVSIAVVADRRGRGVAGEALRALQATVAGDPQIVGLRALVRPDNAASRSVFARAGFLTVGEQDGMIAHEWLQVA
jgi:RimJ/RimL family protein N-acetyltransferase